MMSMIEKKVFVLGDKDCGKSSLLHALTGQLPQITEASNGKKASVRRQTFINISHKVKKDSGCCLCIGRYKLATKKETLAFIFTECEEDEGRLRAMNYLDTDVILLCYNVNVYETLSNLKKIWLPEVQYYSPVEVPIIMVGLKFEDAKKIDTEKEGLKRRASYFFRHRKLDTIQREAENLVSDANMFGHILCSTKEKEGLDELKQSLSSAVTIQTSKEHKFKSLETLPTITGQDGT